MEKILSVSVEILWAVILKPVETIFFLKIFSKNAVRMD